jgi:hypothetical protein
MPTSVAAIVSDSFILGEQKRAEDCKATPTEWNRQSTKEREGANEENVESEEEN